jgi:hypothetical protein
VINDKMPVISNPVEKYFAVINFHETPYYIITNTKEEMVSKLNKAYKELTGETYVPYSINDLDDDYRIGYQNQKLDHYISDDWSTVSNNRKTFDEDMERFNPRPEKYVSKS